MLNAMIRRLTRTAARRKALAAFETLPLTRRAGINARRIAAGRLPICAEHVERLPRLPRIPHGTHPTEFRPYY